MRLLACCAMIDALRTSIRPGGCVEGSLLLLLLLFWSFLFCALALSCLFPCVCYLCVLSAGSTEGCCAKVR